VRRALALAAALLLIAVVTLSPRGGRTLVELMPLTDLSEAVGERDLTLLLKSFANVLLFMPLGAALGLYDVSLRSALLASVALSGAIEVAQFVVVPGRTSSVDDVVLNTLGAILGYLLVSGLRRRTVRFAPRNVPS
jgi:glycopeptide antibiotics resistance protein